MASSTTKGKSAPKAPAPGSVTGKETKLIRAKQKPVKPQFSLDQLMVMSKKLGGRVRPIPEDSDGEVVESEAKTSGSIASLSVSTAVEAELLKTLMKSIFKADHPYRTRLGSFGPVTTSAAGVVNFQQSVSAITSANEWGSIDALFDEFFVHSMVISFMPHNLPGGYTNTTGTMAGQITYATMNPAFATTTGLIAASLFNGAGVYSTAAAMLSNPTKAYFHSSKPFKYFWRNNVRFEPRGIAMSSSTTESWQGWTLVSGGANYGGVVQIRAFNDQVLGDTSHAYQPGAVAVVWDVSFRARA